MIEFGPSSTMRPTPKHSARVDLLEVQIYDTAKDAGEAAAWDDAQYVLELTRDKGLDSVNVLLARAHSQRFRWGSTGGGLTNPLGLGNVFPYEQVRFCCMDEFWGQDISHPGSLASALKGQAHPEVYERMQIYQFAPCGKNIEEEAYRYSQILRESMPLHLTQSGIGTGREDGTSPHMAFMDYPWASFDPNDPRLIMPVELPLWCREQQKKDFPIYKSIDDVPRYALSATIRVIMSAERLSCLVVDEYKANAVRVTLTADINPENPATIMRTHPNAVLYLDNAAAKAWLHD